MKIIGAFLALALVALGTAAVGALAAFPLSWAANEVADVYGARHLTWWPSFCALMCASIIGAFFVVTAKPKDP